MMQKKPYPTTYLASSGDGERREIDTILEKLTRIHDIALEIGTALNVLADPSPYQMGGLGSLEIEIRRAVWDWSHDSLRCRELLFSVGGGR